MSLLALDLAILPPPEVSRHAIALSAALPADPGDTLRLDHDHLPHLTLTQQFIETDELNAVFDRVHEVLRVAPPLSVRVTGAGKYGGSVWMAIERSEVLVGLHERLMEPLREFEREGGTTTAFFDGDARAADVRWVTHYRHESSFGAFTPHITLGHADAPPTMAPFSFDATTIAACHLGRFCTCRRALRVWTLRTPAGPVL